MNFVREFIESSYTNFKADIGINGLELVLIPFIIIVIAFVFGALYTIVRTLSQIHLERSIFIQSNFLIGSSFFCLAVLNSWAIFYMGFILEWFIILPSTGYALSIVWLLPAIAGLSYFERWKNFNLHETKKGIKGLPEWVVPVGAMAVSLLLLIGLVSSLIEYNLATDCQKIGTTEESEFTEEESIEYRKGCESMKDNIYLFGFLIMPIMLVGMILATLYPLLKSETPQN